LKTRAYNRNLYVNYSVTGSEKIGDWLFRILCSLRVSFGCFTHKISKPERTVMNRKSHFYIIAVFLIASYMITGIMPAEANEDDWSSLTVTLGNENPIISVVSVDEYTLEALKFDSYGMVWLRISKNGLTLGDTVLENNSSSWCYMDNDNIRLKACNVTNRENLPMFSNLCSPEAEVVFETKKSAEEKPVEDTVSLDLDFEADKDEYLLGDEVTVDTELRNTGNVKADKIKFDVDPDGLLVHEGVPENITIDKGSTKSFELQLRFPEKIKESYNITANVSWEDNSGKHFLSKVVEIKVSEPLNIYKYTGSEVFTGTPAYVTLSVKNIQDRSVNVSLIDLLPATFTMINSSEPIASVPGMDNSSYLSQDFVLAPEEMRTFSYSVKSEKLGVHRVPQTHAYADLCGQLYSECSDSENTIKVCENISYKEYERKISVEKIPPVETKLHVDLVPA